MGRDGDREHTINMPVFHGEAPQRAPVKIQGAPMYIAVIMVGVGPRVYGPFPSRAAAERWIQRDMPGMAFNSAVTELLDPDEVSDDATE